MFRIATVAEVRVLSAHVSGSVDRNLQNPNYVYYDDVVRDEILKIIETGYCETSQSTQTWVISVKEYTTLIASCA